MSKRADKAARRMLRAAEAILLQAERHAALLLETAERDARRLRDEASRDRELAAHEFAIQRERALREHADRREPVDAERTEPRWASFELERQIRSALALALEESERLLREAEHSSGRAAAPEVSTRLADMLDAGMLDAGLFRAGPGDDHDDATDDSPCVAPDVSPLAPLVTDKPDHPTASPKRPHRFSRSR